MDSRVLCECGCGQPAPIAKRTNSKRGHAAGQPVRYIFGHKRPSASALAASAAASRKHSQDIAGRFAAFVSDGDSADCWEWQGYRDRHGYGLFVIRGINHRAHRIAWVLANGPVAASEVVCHRCDNPSCVNIAHLFVGRATDNVADCVAKGRARGGSSLGELNPASKLTETDVVEIRRRVAAGELQCVVAKEFGVSKSAVADIHHNRSWRHAGITGPCRPVPEFVRS